MKILHITAMAPLSPNSGVPVVLKYLTEEQNKTEGVEARVLALCASVDNINSIFFDSLGTMKIDDYIDHFNPDMAIIHSFFHLQYAIAAKALKRKNIPFFIEPHGSFGRKAIKKGILKKWLANHTIFRTLLKDATGYIFTNASEEQNSVYIPKQSSVIPNGIVETIARNSADKTEYSLKNPIFYFLGRYDIHHKGLDYLLDALRIIDVKNENLIVRFYGTGNAKQIKYVRNRIAEFTHIDVKEMGTIYGNMKKEALENANILLLTSRYEGSPMTILDGFCYGNPCIVTPGSNVADEVDENNVGWKTDLKAQSIADCIIMAKCDYVKNGTEYAKRCKNYAIDNYAWSKVASLSITEYKQMINR